MRSKISENLSQFASEEVKKSFEKLLEETGTWLYNEGLDVTKSVYSKKLEDLHALGDPIVRRKYEFENRYELLMSLRSAMEQLKLVANSVDPKYDHIEQEERKKVLEQISSAEKWVEDLMTKQEKIPNSQDPILTCAQISAKKSELEKFCNPILNKPKPKVEEKKEEKKVEKKQDEKKGETKQDEKKEEPKPEEKKTEEVKMDLD